MPDDAMQHVFSKIVLVRLFPIAAGNQDTGAHGMQEVQCPQGSWQAAVRIRSSRLGSRLATECHSRSQLMHCPPAMLLAAPHVCLSLAKGGKKPWLEGAQPRLQVQMVMLRRPQPAAVAAALKPASSGGTRSRG